MGGWLQVPAKLSALHIPQYRSCDRASRAWPQGTAKKPRRSLQCVEWLRFKIFPKVQFHHCLKILQFTEPLYFCCYFVVIILVMMNMCNICVYTDTHVFFSLSLLLKEQQCSSNPSNTPITSFKRKSSSFDTLLTGPPCSGQFRGEWRAHPRENQWLAPRSPNTPEGRRLVTGTMRRKCPSLLNRPLVLLRKRPVKV